MRRRREQLINELELLLFQRNEIEQADIRIGEEEELDRERRILDSARDLMASADTLSELLGGDEGSILNLLGAARKELDKMRQELDELREELKAR